MERLEPLSGYTTTHGSVIRPNIDDAISFPAATGCRKRSRLFPPSTLTSLPWTYCVLLGLSQPGAPCVLQEYTQGLLLAATATGNKSHEKSNMLVVLKPIDG